ncbi:unnamed protein product [Rotaria sp. Silwood1]|nr:unnamed protein product [Rotaria sp. Silwood1]CAF3669681.1 unnamed protein product [Rotaria sp. Silwood1]
MKIQLSILFLICSIASSMGFVCPIKNGAYPHEWNKAVYYSCSKGCAYQQNCPLNRYYYSKTNKCELKPTDWSPQFNLTGRYQWNSSNLFMDIIQTGYDVQWIYESNDDRQIFVGQYVNETMIMGMKTSLKKATNCIVLENLQLSVLGKHNFCQTQAKFYCYCIDELPGLSDISSGYDAAKMLSANEQNSKYRIFDLSEQRATPFKTEIQGKDRTFAIPKDVQVADISLRKVDSCETIAYTFESFFQSYFHSITFGIRFSIPSSINVVLGYSGILKQIHDVMTKNEKAVGVSTIWWGLYSVQLAPPLSLKLDPTFNQSVGLLVSEAPNPSTEDHQEYYNQFIQTYGTHYISRIIVGGTAHLYTLMDSSYYKESSYEERINQVGLMFRYQKVGLENGINIEQIWASMKEKFRTTSSTLSVFQPPVASQQNKSDWETWQQTAGNHPVIVNRTLFPIYNLIKKETTVRQHLRKTIDFYLESGVFPTLAELNDRGTRRKSLVPPKPQGPINGLDAVGCGYDPLLMESKFCIFDHSNFTDNEQWSDPYNKTLTYSIPNGWFVVNTPESLTFDGSILVTSVEDYFRSTRTVTVTESSGWLGIRRKRTERTVTDFYRRFYQDYYNLVLRMKQIGWYTLSVSAFPYPKLNPIAQTAFDNLPTRFDVKDLKIWQDFFDIFGTHVVVSSNMGGQVWAETWYEKCLTYEHTQTWIDEQVTKSWFIFVTSAENSNDYRQQIAERFRQHSISSAQLLGGTVSIDPSEWEKWAPTIKRKPHPISYRLISLDEILPESDLRNVLKAAINYVLKLAEKEDRNYINQLESLRGPPKNKCSQNEIRTKRQKRATNYEEAKRVLCPYIGYNGTECLGRKATERDLVAENATKLPIGVGMTLDITTGTLLLPALEYTYLGNSYWTDPILNTTYQVPRGVSLPAINQSDNTPIARVFLTATELSNEWKYKKLRGSWLGGEFGHSKSLGDIYRRFFSNNQGTAITQKPTVLYRLRVENLQLNKYVKQAISKLPIKYDETLYRDFLRNWGTHIVQQSLIGGMHEQQVLFKDCVFSFNGAITSDNLDDYLKKDILSETLGNSFYADRRKISVDHWLGGDPIEKNEILWQQTLAANPALLKIEEYIPWSDVIEIDPNVRNNLRKIIQARTAAADKVRIDEENRLNEQYINGSYMARKGSIGLLNNDTCDIIPATFGSVKDCSEGCPTNTQIRLNDDFFDNQQLWYVRDETTGFIRARARIDGQTVLEGSMVNAGCSSIAVGGNPTISAHICVSCDLVSSFANQCVCVCPTYSSSSG